MMTAGTKQAAGSNGSNSYIYEDTQPDCSDGPTLHLCALQEVITPLHVL